MSGPWLLLEPSHYPSSPVASLLLGFFPFLPFYSSSVDGTIPISGEVTSQNPPMTPCPDSENRVPHMTSHRYGFSEFLLILQPCSQARVCALCFSLRRTCFLGLLHASPELNLSSDVTILYQPFEIIKIITIFYILIISLVHHLYIFLIISIFPSFPNKYQGRE